jgi:hypothetical protein
MNQFKFFRENILFNNPFFSITYRIFASVISDNLISVQPMNVPRGVLFYLDLSVNPDYYETLRIDSNKKFTFFNGYK